MKSCEDLAPMIITMRNKCKKVLLLFPNAPVHDNSGVKPLGICTSFVNIKGSCRAENSFVGDQRSISEVVAAPWVVNSRWVDGVWTVDQNSQGICMGHGSPVFAHSVLWHCASCFFSP